MSVEWDEAGWDEVTDAVHKVITKAVVQGENGAKRRAAVDTGRMRSSITHNVERQGDEVVGQFGTNVEYSIYVELGTRNMAAQPFLRPALGDIKLGD